MNVRVSSNTSIFRGSLQFPLSCLAWEIFDSNCIFLDNNLKKDSIVYVFTQQYYYFTKILIKLTLQIRRFFSNSKFEQKVMILYSQGYFLKF